VIKRLRFADHPGWRDEIAVAIDAPIDARPVRVAVSTAFAPDDDERPLHRGVIEEWFEDEAHLRRVDAQTAQTAQTPQTAQTDEGLHVVVADAVILRGAEWLERRWLDGSPKLKHMALATRAPGLTSAEFSARWRDHAGQARTSTGTAAIPESVKGLAYVQNHPLAGHAAAYDAVNEVYFDDLDALRQRIAWFRDNGIGREPDELFGTTAFLAVREEAVAINPG